MRGCDQQFLAVAALLVIAACAGACRNAASLLQEMQAALDDGEDAVFAEKARKFLGSYPDHPERERIRYELAAAIVAQNITQPSSPAADEARALLLAAEAEAGSEGDRFRAALLRMKFSPADDAALASRKMLETYQQPEHVRQILLWAVAELQRLDRPAEAVEFARLYLERVPEREDSAKYRRIVRRAGLQGAAPPFSAAEREGIGAALNRRLVLLDFWASWCRPCAAEIPELLALYRRYHRSGLEIVAIGVDKELADHQKFTAENSVPWIVIHAADEAIVDRFGVDMLPQHFLIEDGRIIAADGALEDLEQLISTRLGLR